MAKRKRKLQNTKKTFTVKVPAANRNYKDTVFRMLFSNRKNLLSLYNAVNQRDYKNPDDLEIVTLENAIYMGMKNDLALSLILIYICTSTSQPTIQISLFGIYSILVTNIRNSWIRNLSILLLCKKFLRRILLSFIMVQRYCLTALNLSFLQHLKICQANQSLN